MDRKFNGIASSLVLQERLSVMELMLSKPAIIETDSLKTTLVQIVMVRLPRRWATVVCVHPDR
jgi:hypothetical protein